MVRETTEECWLLLAEWIKCFRKLSDINAFAKLNKMKTENGLNEFQRK